MVKKAKLYLADFLIVASIYGELVKMHAVVMLYPMSTLLIEPFHIKS